MPLTAGRTYNFKVEARNSVGYSGESIELGILAATVPGQPSIPSTSISDANVAISWAVPDDGSAPILGYVILIRQEDGITFTEDSVNCDGSNASIVSAHACAVPISRLRANPYNLPWGSSIYVKVSAINIQGESL